MALTERLALIIEASAGQAVAEFKKVGAQAKVLEGETGGATRAMGGLGQAGNIAGGLLKAAVVAGAAAAGSAITKFAVDGVNSFVNLADEVRRFQGIAGGTPEAASRMVAAFKAVGVDADTAGTAVFQLEKRLTTNAGALRKFGVEAVKDAKGNTDVSATLLSVGDAYKRIQDPQERAALLAAAFGKSGTALIPILSKSREEIEAYGAAADKHHEILSAEDLAKAKEYKLALHDLSEAFSGLEREAGQALVPFLSGLASATTKGLEFIDKVLNAKIAGHSWIKDAVVAVVNPFSNLDVSDDSKKATDATDDNTKAVEANIAAVDEDTKQTAALSKSLFSLESAHRAVDDAVRADEAAHRALIDKTKTLNDLVAKGAVNEKAVAAARKEVETAERELTKSRTDLVKATDNLDDAERALNEAIQPATVEALAAAYDNLHSAQLDAGDAQQSLNEATDTYNKMLAASQSGTSLDPASSDELAIAQGDVNDAQGEWQKKLRDGKSTVADTARAHKHYTDTLETLDKLQKRGIVTEADLSKQHEVVERATITLDGANQRATTSQSDLYGVMHTGAENDPAVVAARDKVTGATAALADATQHVADGIANVTEKQAALGTALAGDPNYSDKVIKARQDVADATQHVADAEYNVAQQKAGYEEAKKVLDDTVATGGPGAVLSVRNQIDALLAKKPELAAFFDPMLADLGSAVDAVNTISGPFPAGSIGEGLGLNAVISTITAPRHAAGGVATKPTFGIFGEAGPEALVPLDQWQGGKGGGVTVIINVAGNVLDGRDLGDLAHSALLDKQARAGNLGFVAA